MSLRDRLGAVTVTSHSDRLGAATVTSHSDRLGAATLPRIVAGWALRRFLASSLSQTAIDSRVGPERILAGLLALLGIKRTFRTTRVDRRTMAGRTNSFTNPAFTCHAFTLPLSGHRFRIFQTELFHLFVQRRAINTQLISGLISIPAILTKHLEDDLSLRPL